jgi:hypothetical protein
VAGAAAACKYRWRGNRCRRRQRRCEEGAWRRRRRRRWRLTPGGLDVSGSGTGAGACAGPHTCGHYSRVSLTPTHGHPPPQRHRGATAAAPGPARRPNAPGARGGASAAAAPSRAPAGPAAAGADLYAALFEGAGGEGYEEEEGAAGLGGCGDAAAAAAAGEGEEADEWGDEAACFAEEAAAGGAGSAGRTVRLPNGATVLTLGASGGAGDGGGEHAWGSLGEEERGGFTFAPLGGGAAAAVPCGAAPAPPAWAQGAPGAAAGARRPAPPARLRPAPPPQPPRPQPPAAQPPQQQPKRGGGAAASAAATAAAAPQRVVHPDGKVEEFYADGRRAVHFANGTVRDRPATGHQHAVSAAATHLFPWRGAAQRLTPLHPPALPRPQVKLSDPSGAEQVVFANGDVKRSSPCGRVDYFYAEVAAWQVGWGGGRVGGGAGGRGARRAAWPVGRGARPPHSATCSPPRRHVAGTAASLATLMPPRAVRATPPPGDPPLRHRGVLLPLWPARGPRPGRAQGHRVPRRQRAPRAARRVRGAGAGRGVAGGKNEGPARAALELPEACAGPAAQPLALAAPTPRTELDITQQQLSPLVRLPPPARHA